MDAWFRASEKMATLSSFLGVPLSERRDAMLPIPAIKVKLAAKPDGKRRHSCNISSSHFQVTYVYNFCLGFSYRKKVHNVNLISQFFWFKKKTQNTLYQH